MSSSLPSGGQPVQIVNFKLLENKPSHLSLNKSILQKVLQKAGKHQICLISIAGASRQGKSFLLTIILNVLERISQGSKNYWEEIEKLEKLNGFQFRNGTERETVGLWLWSEPFILTKTNGSKIAVILMDTQGVFDNYTTKRDWSMIVGLSLLTSSCLIYNLFNNMQEDTLEIFHTFVEFGMLSLDQDETATSVFQKLVFLIRDWNFPNTNPYGSFGGQSFIKEKLKPLSTMPAELQIVRQKLVTCFEEVTCFLMPNPGDAAKDNDFSGALHKLKDEFRTNLRSFVDELLNVDDLRPTKIDNNEIKGSDLLAYFEKYIQLFNRQTLPAPKSLLEATEEARINSIATSCKEQCQEQFRQILDEMKFIPTQVFKQHCEKLGKEALINFVRKGGNSKSKVILDRYKAVLSVELKEIFSEMFKKNDKAKEEFIAELVDEAFKLFMNNATGTIKDLIHLPKELEEIIHSEKVRTFNYFHSKFANTGHTNPTLTKEAMDILDSKINAYTIDIANQNLIHFNQLESHNNTCILNLVQDYRKLMHLAFSSDPEMKNVSQNALIRSHKSCEEIVLPKLQEQLQSVKAHSTQVAEHFPNKFKMEINLILKEFVEKAKVSQSMADDKALQVFNSALEFYTESMNKIIEDEKSEVELQQEHRILVIEAISKLNSLFHICTPAQAQEYQDNMRKMTLEYLQDVIQKLQKNREIMKANFQTIEEDILNLYVQKMNDAITGSKLLSEEELQKLHKRILQDLIPRLNSYDCLTKQQMTEIESKIKSEIAKKYQNAKLANSQRFEQEEREVRNQIKHLTFVYDEEVEKFVENNGGWGQLQTAEFLRVHPNLVKEIGVNFFSKFPNFSPSMVKPIWDDFTPHFEEKLAHYKYKLEMKWKERADKISGMLTEYEDMYACEIEPLLMTLKNPNDEELARLHSSGQTKTIYQLKMYLRTTEDKDNEIAKEVIDKLKMKTEQRFGKLKEKLVKRLEEEKRKVDLARTDATFTYQTMFEQQFGNANNEQDLQNMHKQIGEQATRQFETNFPVDDMSMFRKEKSKLESEIQEIYSSKILKQFIDLNNEMDKETRAKVLKLVSEYKMDMENHVGKFAFVSDQQLMEFHKDAEKVATLKLMSLNTPKTVKLKEYEAFFHNNIHESIQYYQGQNNSKRESIENEIAEKVEEISSAFSNEISGFNSLETPTLDALHVKWMANLRHSISETYYVPDTTLLEAIYIPSIKKAFDEAVNNWELMEIDEHVIDYQLRKAKESYQEEMDKSIEAKGSHFMSLAELTQIHFGVVSVLKGQIARNVRQTPSIKKRIDELVNALFVKYKDSNMLRAASNAEKAIGIDLGTTYSCVAVYRDGKVEMIPDQNSHVNVTPSYVRFESEKNSVVVGDSAKEHANVYPEETVYDAKRLIGHKFSDPVTQKDIRSWSFPVVEDKDRPKIKVGENTYFPEEISAEVLKKLKEDAEKFLGCDVTNAVITVPAYFNDAQKTATKNAGSIAGLKVMAIVNEPTAAAIAYSLNYSDDKERNILVYDLGGGTFDVSVLVVKGSDIVVKAVAGDNHLGGEDFDTNMVIHCIEKFASQHHIRLDATGDPKDIKGRIRRIRYQCEKAKKALSVSNTHKIVIDGICQNLDFEVEITKEAFNKMNETLFQSTLSTVTKALQDAKIKAEDINDIVLVGGSTRIPRVQELLKTYFSNKSFNLRINPDEVVAQGAAILAAMRSGSEQLGITFKDVAPLSLGIEVKGGGFSRIINRNTQVPCSKTAAYKTTENYQTSVNIAIFEGEDPVVAKNNLLGEFVLSGIPPNWAGREKIDVTISCDEEGILNVKARCKSTGGEKDATIKAERGGLTEKELNKLITRPNANVKRHRKVR